MVKLLELPREENSYYDDDRVNVLPKACLFVYGSNLSGRHGKGAALQAKQLYGAVYGQAVGLQGRSYAIPTKDAELKPLSLELIQTYVDDFVRFTKVNDKAYFYLTGVGTGLAGYKAEEIAPMFVGCRRCWIPERWQKYM